MKIRWIVGAGTLLATSVWAQSVISARSGTIQYTEGAVSVNQQAVQVHSGDTKFPTVDANQTLTTEDGRAEVLLTPGVFLRLAENTSVKMLANKLIDTRVEILSGTAMVEAGEFLQDNAITLVYKGAEIALAKKGLYRVDSDPASLRVYEGEAKVTSGSDATTATRGQMVELGSVLAKSKFDPKTGDEFYRWNARRDGYVAEANVYAAHQAQGMGSGYTGNSWLFNPYLGMYTFAPMSGMYFSPFGYGYFSPFSVGALYMPGYFGYYPYGGYAGVASVAPTYNRSITSGTSPVSPSVSRSPMGSFAASRGAAISGGGASSTAGSGGGAAASRSSSFGGGGSSGGGFSGGGASRGGGGAASSGARGK